MPEIKKFKIKISDISLTDKLLTIKSTENQLFVSKIKKGSVCFQIFDEDNCEKHLGCLEDNSLIKIFGFLNNEENNIIIKKIFIKNKYVFNSESSDDFNGYE